MSHSGDGNWEKKTEKVGVTVGKEGRKESRLETIQGLARSVMHAIWAPGLEFICQNQADMRTKLLIFFLD